MIPRLGGSIPPTRTIYKNEMNESYILIYKSNGFAESKEAEFELRNTFKKYELHASYMTKRKFKTMARADKQYKTLEKVHQVLSHAAFVIFVHPTEECKYKTEKQIIELIALLKKEVAIQNEETHFVGLIKDETCISHEQLINLYTFNDEIENQTEQSINQQMIHTLKNPINILLYNLRNKIATHTDTKQKNEIQRMLTTITTKYLYI